jgi:hypothetical protein
MEAPTGRRAAPPDDRLRAVIRERLSPHSASLHAGYARPLNNRSDASRAPSRRLVSFAQQTVARMEARSVVIRERLSPHSASLHAGYTRPPLNSLSDASRAPSRRLV